MEELETFTWAGAVEVNRKALTRIMAEIFALLGFVAGGTVERLPHALYAAAERLLRPAEAALRRLIVIAARGLIVKPSPKRLMAKGLKIEPKTSGRMSFRLFDKRKRFDFIQPENPFFVKAKIYCDNPFNLFNAPYQPRLEEQTRSINLMQLSRRLAAMSHALESPKFTSPLRPGPPHGHRTKPTAEVDFVLQECRWLAWDSLREDSS
jgi:hypothetical protein